MCGYFVVFFCSRFLNGTGHQCKMDFHTFECIAACLFTILCCGSFTQDGGYIATFFTFAYNFVVNTIKRGFLFEREGEGNEEKNKKRNYISFYEGAFLPQVTRLGSNRTR